jgi:hypothetical protein
LEKLGTPGCNQFTANEEDNEAGGGTFEENEEYGLVGREVGGGEGMAVVERGGTVGEGEKNYKEECSAATGYGERNF